MTALLVLSHIIYFSISMLALYSPCIVIDANINTHVIMDENVKNDAKVMLVRQAADNKLKGVTGMDAEGNIQTVAPTAQNAANLLHVNTQDSALEAFFKKFMEEAQNPSHTGIFIMTENALSKLIRIDFDPEILEHYRVNPAELRPDVEEQRFEPLDVSKIDLADMERKGIRLEVLEPHLKAMSYGHKSHGLIEMYPEMEPGGMRVTTKGRVSLEEQADGTLKVIPHYYREKCDLDSPFYNVLLDEEVKRNIMETRHAGKVVELELQPGIKTPCYISRDKWTNELIPMPVSLLEKRTRIKDTDLSEGKQLDFYGGGKVLLEGYTTRAGYKRDAYIQIDAAERSYEFTYDGLNRNRYAQENRELYRQRFAEKTGQQVTERPLRIPHMILKAAVPQEAYDQWTAALNDPSKRPAVQAFYLTGMVKEGQDAPFNAWVRPNFEKNKMDFFRWNPNKRQEVRSASVVQGNTSTQAEGKVKESRQQAPVQEKHPSHKKTATKGLRQ